MKNDLSNPSSPAEELLEAHEAGRKEEALRMTRMALERRFGGLDQHLSQALEQLDTAALEALACDTPTIEHLQTRLFLRQEVSLSSLRADSRPHKRLSPLGGYRNTPAASTPATD